MKPLSNAKVEAVKPSGVMKGFATLGDGVNQVMLFGVLIITVAVVASVTTGVENTQTVGSTAYSATSAGLAGLLNFSNLQPVIGLVLAAVIVLGLLVSSFYGGKR